MYPSKDSSHTRVMRPSVVYTSETGEKVTKTFDDVKLYTSEGATDATAGKVVSEGVVVIPKDGIVEYHIAKVSGENPLF